MTLDEIIELLPYELRKDGNAENIKKLIKIYSKFAQANDEANRAYGEILDIYSAVGTGIDYIGNLFAVFRELGELDDTYRLRIINTIINRKTPTTLPSIQEAVNSIVENGKLYILENHRDKPANVYITGTGNEEDIRRVLTLIQQFLPAGVGVTIPVVSFDTWNAIKNQFSSWSSLGQQNYIW